MNRFVHIAKALIFVHLLTFTVSGFADANTPAAHTNPSVILETSEGNMRIELFPQKAPKTVENFLRYVEDNYYDGLIFHRIIPGFMIQGGGFDTELTRQKTRPPIVNEANGFLPNKRGTIAMARTNDPHSATAQFFINLVNNRQLNKSSQSAGYAVFGQVVEGLEVADRIARIKTERKGMIANVPTKPVIIHSARIATHQK